MRNEPMQYPCYMRAVVLALTETCNVPVPQLRAEDKLSCVLRGPASCANGSKSILDTVLLCYTAQPAPFSLLLRVLTKSGPQPGSCPNKQHFLWRETRGLVLLDGQYGDEASPGEEKGQLS
uniref:SUEL-type lectin domain-containing protein n=1 Tax=Ascaris lumbricoides TaxID=6252 RepID=A0A0M3HX62_ASCLU